MLTDEGRCPHGTAGHARYQFSKELGVKVVGVLAIDGDVQLLIEWPTGKQDHVTLHRRR